MMKLLLLTFVCVLTLAPDEAEGWWTSKTDKCVDSIRKDIVKVAESKVGSTHWSWASSCCHGRNTNKCNYFVYDVGREAGAKMPTRSLWRGPVGAGGGGWGKATSLDYWKRVSVPQPGDIVAAHRNKVYHVGIWVAPRTVVSANSRNIGKNSNMYTHGYQDFVYWRYQGENKS